MYRQPPVTYSSSRSAKPQVLGLFSWILVLRLKNTWNKNTQTYYTYIETKDSTLKLLHGNYSICKLHFHKRIAFSRFWRLHFLRDFHHLWSLLSQEQWQSDEHCDVGTPELEAQQFKIVGKPVVNVIVGHCECINSAVVPWPSESTWMMSTQPYSR